MSRRTSGRGYWVWVGWLLVGLGVVSAPGVAAQTPPQENSNSQQTPARPPTPGNDDPVPWAVWEGAEPWPDPLVVLEDLPQPPAELVELVELGQVEFRFYDAEKQSRRFTGETRLALRYNLKYSYQARVTGSGRRRRLVVKLEHQPTKFSYQHQILLPLSHGVDSLYSLPLVLHELDHVKIGIDPRYPALFDQWLVEQTKVLTLTWGVDSRTEDVKSLVQEAMQTEAEKCFDKLLQLMQVRQRDLDRITRHGLDPLPVDFFTTPPAMPPSDQL